MAEPTTPLRIGYLPFYVDYYEGICPDFPREKTAIAKRCADVLKSHGDVVWDGELIRDVATATTAGARLSSARLDCVVVLPTIAVFGGIPWAAIRALDLPVLIWNAQQIKRVGHGYSMVEIVRNTSQIGTQAMANTLLREGRWFRVVTGYEKNKRTADDLRRFFGTIRAAAAMRRARLVAVGDGFPLMTDIEIDERELAAKLGASVVRVGRETLESRYASVTEKDVETHLHRVKKQHRVTNITADELRRSVRLCEAVSSIVDEHAADGGTVNCHGGNCLRNPQIGVTACYTLGVQNALGRPFTCTGDIPTALAMLMLKKLTGVGMYTEVQVMDETRKAVVIANSGEGEDGIRDRRSRSSVAGNTNFRGIHGRGTSFAYPIKPGPATLVSLTPTPRGKSPYRVIVAEGTILRDRIPDAGALAGFFRFDGVDLHSAYRRWLELGAVHHAATTTGHWARELADVAELMGIEIADVRKSHGV